MDETPRTMITRLLGNRKALLELVIAALLLALSVNLISSALLELKWISPLWAFGLGSVLVVACIFYFVATLLWSRTHRHEFQGFIVCHTKKNAVVDVPRYDYGSRLHGYLTAAFAENPAIENIWSKEPIDKGFRYDKETGKASLKLGKGHQLIAEATEYYVLENLSTHLTDYFNRPDFDQHELHTFARKDIPDVLLSNRFLELFSKPMEDRPLFSAKNDSLSNEDDIVRITDTEECPLVSTDSAPRVHENQVVWATGGGGAFYSRFDLTLPKGARVKRTHGNGILIETNRFAVTILVDFRGFGTVIPSDYQRYILGLKPSECREYEVRVTFNVSFRFASLFLRGGWDYYRWIESFMKSFEARFSEDSHFSRIGWESVLTLIKYHERQTQSSPEQRDIQPDS